MIERIVNRFRAETGATAVEYGLFVALIAAVIVGVVFVLGGQVQEGLQTVSDEIANVQP
jgi:pilus assembly protein Flp/PilA